MAAEGDNSQPIFFEDMRLKYLQMGYNGHIIEMWKEGYKWHRLAPALKLTLH